MGEVQDSRWSARRSLSFLGNGLMASVREPRRWWGLAVLFPALFGGLAVADLLAHTSSEAAAVTPDGPARLPDWHDRVGQLAWPAKWLTVPSLPVLLVLLAEKVAERPARWRQAAGTWIVVGITLVLVVASRMADIGEAISNVASWRLWPGPMFPGAERSLEELGGFGPNWTPAQIVVRELVAVVVIAFTAALALRRCAGAGTPVLAAGAVPLAVLGPLVAYWLATPWSFRFDFDFFVGDAVLGATFGELVFAPAPFDPIGAAAIGLSALSMGALILAWGGVVPGPARPSAAAACPAGDPAAVGSLPEDLSGS